VGYAFIRAFDGSFTTFNAPGAGTASGQGTFGAANNLLGVVTGNYIDANGVEHGYLRIP
jgi:hypothetical protein